MIDHIDDTMPLTFVKGGIDGVRDPFGIFFIVFFHGKAIDQDPKGTIRMVLDRIFHVKPFRSFFQAPLRCGIIASFQTKRGYPF
jgi:hypothetical protein